MCDAKVLARRYSDSPQKMSFNQLKNHLEINNITYDEFLKELNSVEWEKTIEVFKLCFLTVAVVWMCCWLIVRI